MSQESTPTILPGSNDQAMTGRELCAALRVSLGTFYRNQSLGRYERFELRPRIGLRKYSRKLVQEYLDGQPSSRTWAETTAGPRAVHRTRRA